MERELELRTAISICLIFECKKTKIKCYEFYFLSYSENNYVIIYTLQ